MAATPDAEPEKPKKPTKLAEWRLKRGATQNDMARDTGIPMSTYQRIEAGTYDRPPYQQLNNCAIVLEVGVEELIEDEDKAWTVFHASAAAPPTKPSWRAHEQQPE